ncbi:MAG: DUF1805 domain-containing protein [Candidatus Omnitrophota bacterium]|jgi:uncharacterized protein YunC (DUF1805 family)|nr:MAG: DUF1805 domain-containing protein [Candidatus Omnitrophota bacterium]
MSVTVKKIRAGKKYIDALVVKLQSKNLVLIRGSRGYIMCGYLDLGAAEKFKDTAVVVKGVEDIDDVLKSKVYSCTSEASKLGIYAGQPIKDILEIIC